MQDFRKLRVWTSARQLALRIYLLTRSFPPEERYGLKTQMRRAAVSVCANIAEGCGRGKRGEFITFLRYAFGSACELECQTILAGDLKLLSDRQYVDTAVLLTDVKRMLSGLIRKVGD